MAGIFALRCFLYFIFNSYPMPQDSQIEVIQVLIIGFVMIVGLIIFLGYFLIAYQRRRINYETEKKQMEERFRGEMFKAKVELQESVLKYLSQEIHDNIGQIMSIIKMNLFSLERSTGDAYKRKIDTAKEMTTKAIEDLRLLSKMLNSDYIIQQGLKNAIINEIELMNRAQIIKVDLEVEGKEYRIENNKELILFRMFQEISNNSIKHSGSEDIKVSLNYGPKLTMTVSDHGKGFNAETLNSSGLGIKTIRERASMINATVDVKSAPGQGCTYIITT